MVLREELPEYYLISNICILQKTIIHSYWYIYSGWVYQLTDEIDIVTWEWQKNNDKRGLQNKSADSLIGRWKTEQPYLCRPGVSEILPAKQLWDF